MSGRDEWRPYIDCKASDETLFTQLNTDEIQLERNRDILERLETGLRPNDVRAAIRELTKRNWRHDVDPVAVNAVLSSTALAHFGFGNFFNEVLPWVANNAIKLRSLFPSGLQRLQIQRSTTLTLTAEQCLCMLSAIFLGATPLEHRLFTIHRSCSSKLISMINYFSVLHQRQQQGVPLSNLLTFHRIVESPKPLSYWTTSDHILTTFTHYSNIAIEDYSSPSLQVDFANKYIGGGVMETGCVQEEICFMVHPELIVSILMSDVMENNEAIVIVGAERFTQHDGYGSSVTYGERYHDKRPVDRHGRLDSHFVAIDALELIGRSKKQYQPEMVERELNKAYAGFRGDHLERTDLEQRVIDKLKPVCTGRWGCGVFGGDSQIKALIQWAAASENDRDIVFMTFGDPHLNDLQKIVSKYEGKTVGKLIEDVNSCLDVLKRSEDTTLFNELLML